MATDETADSSPLSIGRLEAFSDGVFAIAITLLVLNLTVPVTRGDLWHALSAEWPNFASYVVSFLIIGIIWVNHHAIFRQIARVDRTLLFFNLLLLMFVSLIPFPTALMAKYIESGANSHPAAVVYSATSLGMSLAFALIWGYAAFTDNLRIGPLTRPELRARLIRFSAGSVVYVLTIGVALVNAVACLIIHGLLATYYIFDQTGGASVVPDGETDNPTAVER